jgi:hypothetical protein
VFLEFKKRWKNVPKSTQVQQIGMDESWQYVLTSDKFVAIVRGYSECDKIVSSYLTEGFLRKINAKTYTNLLKEIKALRASKWPHKGILNSKYLDKPKAKK